MRDGQRGPGTADGPEDGTEPGTTHTYRDGTDAERTASREGAASREGTASREDSASREGTAPRENGGTITLGAAELTELLLHMGRATTSGELGVYHREELERAHESSYSQGWQDALAHLTEQTGVDPETTPLAEVIALADAPLPAPSARELREREPLMPHRKRGGGREGR